LEHEKEEKIEKKDFDHHEHHEHKKEHKMHESHDKHELKNKIKKKLQDAKRDKTILGTLAIIFLVLFVVTIFTKSSACDDLDSQITALYTYSSSLTLPSAKSAVDNAISNLESAKTIIADEISDTNTSVPPPVWPTSGRPDRYRSGPR